MMTIDKYIQERIIKLRDTKKDLSERKLSELLGFNPTYLTQIINGSALPSFESLEIICKYFHITLSDFFNESYKADHSTEMIAKKIKDVTDPEDIEDFIKILDNTDKEITKALIKAFINYSKSLQSK